MRAPPKRLELLPIATGIFWMRRELWICGNPLIVPQAILTKPIHDHFQGSSPKYLV